MVQPIEGSNVRKARAPQAGAMSLAASVTVVLKARQVNVGSRAARVVDSGALDGVVDSGGKRQ